MGEQRSDRDGNDADTVQNESSGKYHHRNHIAPQNGIYRTAGSPTGTVCCCGESFFFYLIFPWKIENAHGSGGHSQESMVVAVSADGPDGGNGTGNELVPGRIPYRSRVL